MRPNDLNESGSQPGFSFVQDGILRRLDLFEVDVREFDWGEAGATCKKRGRVAEARYLTNEKGSCRGGPGRTGAQSYHGALRRVMLGH